MPGLLGSVSGIQVMNRKCKVRLVLLELSQSIKMHSV